MLNLQNNVASQNKRFLNFLLDSGLIYLLIIFSPNFIFDFLILIPPAYYLLFEGLFHKTPAKFFTKTIVKKSDGKNLGFKDIFIRTLSRFIPFEAFTFLGNKNPIGWHDRISKTLVVSTTE